MCGIVAILRSPEAARRSLAGDLSTLVDRGLAEAEALSEGELTPERLQEATRALSELDSELSRVPGVRALVLEPVVADEISRRVAAVGRWLDEKGAATKLGAEELEALDSRLIPLRDRLWALGRDRVDTARRIRELAGGASHPAAICALLSVEQALAALDRLEVRGRDSAGLQLWITGVDELLSTEEVLRAIEKRTRDPLYQSGSVRRVDGALGMVYKVAAEIGELGDNVAALRAALAEDDLFHSLLRADSLRLSVLAHTRWASVGLINEANAHPLEQVALDEDLPSAIAVLNGDVDNYAELRDRAGLRFAEEITTDAKVIPALWARSVASGLDPDEAFRSTVADFMGSVAVAGSLGAEPHRLRLALRGSGQALYVGLAEDVFVVASEPYGVVEVTSRYLRLDGEAIQDAADPQRSRGQVVSLDGDRAGSLEGLRRLGYHGRDLPVAAGELKIAEITTRDVDRGAFPHYLLKEIREAPSSFRKTLRGKLVVEDGRRRVDLGRQALSDAVAARLREGSVRRILVIGQGTAAVAAQGVAAAIQAALETADLREIRALPATELSGFGLRSDMSDTLIVAISQSGTTTDTNRTVDLVRGRGATVLAIVNRRNSDLTDKADGVLYTSDGRDVEMSVASTKAFYAQVAAGHLLAAALRQELGEREDAAAEAQQRRLAALEALPDAMERLIEERASEIAAIADREAPPARYWALVGNGHNRIAAEEIRIKLSELCYKSIACDATEDKKHIDLSSEPLILVCAAGLRGSTAGDVAKEIAIYRAHKATPIVIASEGEERFAEAAAVVAVPKAHAELDYVLAALAGHLFGYHAALAIDRQAQGLRRIRAVIDELAVDASASSADWLRRLREETAEPVAAFLEGLRRGRYDGHLEASTGAELALLLRMVQGAVPIDAWTSVAGGASTPAAVVEAVIEALTEAIDQLTRPVDAIKHQAKTVTVGISRADEALLHAPLVESLMESGVERDRISYADLSTLAALDPLVREVTGFTRYAVEGDPASDEAVIRVVASGGIARDLGSRTRDVPRLVGTKRTVAAERRLLVARGRRDDRLFVLVPEVDGGHSRGLVLLHVSLERRVEPGVAEAALRAYRKRYEQLRDAVMETEASFRGELLAEVEVERLLLDPVGKLAELWRAAGAEEPESGGLEVAVR